jgi:hypothetical protein
VRTGRGQLGHAPWVSNTRTARDCGGQGRRAGGEQRRGSLCGDYSAVNGGLSRLGSGVTIDGPALRLVAAVSAAQEQAPLLGVL